MTRLFLFPILLLFSSNAWAAEKLLPQVVENAAGDRFQIISAQAAGSPQEFYFTAKPLRLFPVTTHYKGTLVSYSADNKVYYAHLEQSQNHSFSVQNFLIRTAIIATMVIAAHAYTKYQQRSTQKKESSDAKTHNALDARSLLANNPVS